MDSSVKVSKVGEKNHPCFIHLPKLHRRVMEIKNIPLYLDTVLQLRLYCHFVYMDELSKVSEVSESVELLKYFLDPNAQMP